MSLATLEMPRDTRPSTRIEWAGERISDMAEGIIRKQTDAALVANVIVGWTDVWDGHQDEYIQLARLFIALMNEKWPKH
jgi:hypothetical protein